MIKPTLAARLRETLPRAGRTLRYFAPALRSQTPQLGIALGLTLFQVLTEVLRPWPLQIVIDYVLAPGRRSTAALSWLADGRYATSTIVVGAAIATLAIVALGGLFEYGKTVVLSGVGQRVVARIRRDLFRHLLRLPPQWHTRQSHGDILLRLSGDIVMLRELLVGGLVDAVSSLLLLVGTIAMMWWLNPTLTVVSLVAVPPVALLGGVLARRIRRAVRKTREKEGALATRASESLGAVAMLQVFGVAERTSASFERENRSNLRSSLKASRLEALLARSLDLAAAAGTALTLALGAFAVQRGELTAGGLVAFFAYQRTLYRPLRRLAMAVSRASKAASCGERVIDVLQTRPAIADRPGARPCPPARGSLRFENVSVRYERGDLALDGVDFELPAGAVITVRGESGAGKSTLLSLVARLLDPTEGRVLLDGVDVREYTLESLREQVAVVFQDSVLLGLSVRDNIALGRSDASEDDILRAAEQAGVLRFAGELPNGLDTVVGERGAELSGGQRQRIAIARAALRRAPVLLLDEPFAHLDDTSRDHVAAALRQLMHGRTVLIVTHREHPGFEADHEVVLAAGRVVSQRDLAGVA